MSKNENLEWIKNFSKISITKICNDLNVSRSNVLNGFSSEAVIKQVKEEIIKNLNALDDKPNEFWKDICFIENGVVYDYTGYYQASNLGRIKNLNYNGTGRAMILKNSLNSKGYLNTVLTKNNVRKTISTHQIIARMFIPNPDNKKQVNHINCIKTDNRVENLEWCSQLENIHHAMKNNLCHYGDYKTRKIVQLDLNQNFIKEWESISKAASELKIHQSNITKNCQHKLKTAYGYIWRYKEEFEKQKVS